MTRTDAMDAWLQLVLPVLHGDGLGYMSVIGYPDPDNATALKYKQRIWPTTSALTTAVMAEDGRAGHPCYFALAAFPIEAGYGRWASRRAAGAVYVRSFWLDIDCLSPAKQASADRASWVAADTGKYFDKPTAVAALCEFVKAARLPVPMVVDSGNGLHVYWTFTDTAVACDDTWRTTAARLGALAAHFNFTVDPSRTSDIASILRPVGSTHIKPDSTEHRVVSVLSYGAGPQPYAALCDAIAAAALVNGVTIERLRVSKAAPKDVTNALNALPADARGVFLRAQTGHADGHDRTAAFEPIRQQCAQMRGFGDTPYDSRLLAASIVSHCRDGRAIYINESLNCPTLRANGSVASDDDARTKATAAYDRWLDEGITPAYCAAWQGTDTAEKCQGCEHRGKADFSPVSLGLGRARTQVEAAIAAAERPVELVETRQGHRLEVMPMPSGFRERNGQLEFAATDDDGIVTWHLLLPSGTLRLVHVLEESGRTGPTSKYVFHRVMAYDKTRKGDFVEFAPRQLSRKQELLDRLLDMQLVPANDVMMHRYMKASLVLDGIDLPVHTVLNHYGWLTADDMETRVGPNAPIRTASTVPFDPELSTRFVLHDRCFYPGGDTRVFYTPQAESTAVTRGVRSEGTLAGWQRAVDVLVRNGQTAALFCVALSFGSALMEFAPAGTANPIVNFWAPASGTGKSTVLRIAAAIWAHPDRSMAQADDSAAARSLYMPDFYSLPICIDEITNIRDEELSKFVFAAARGVERATATRDRSSREARRWCSVVLATANNTIAAKIAEFSKERPGEQMRALDILLPYPQSVRGRTVDAADLAALEHNYGVAGPAFVQRLLADVPRMRAAVERLRKLSVEGVPGHALQDGERFWSTAAAAAVVGAELAREFGIVNFDVDGIAAFAVEAITQQRELQTSVCGTDGVSVVDAFYTEHVGRAILRVKDNNPDSPVPQSAAAESGYVLEPQPVMSVVGRYEVAEGRFIVLASEFDKYCRRNNHNPDTVLAAAYAAGALHESHELRPAGGVNRVRYPLLLGSHMGTAESATEPNRPRRMMCYVFQGTK